MAYLATTSFLPSTDTLTVLSKRKFHVVTGFLFLFWARGVGGNKGGSCCWETILQLLGAFAIKAANLGPLTWHIEKPTMDTGVTAESRCLLWSTEQSAGHLLAPRLPRGVRGEGSHILKLGLRDTRSVHIQIPGSQWCSEPTSDCSAMPCFLGNLW